MTDMNLKYQSLLLRLRWSAHRAEPTITVISLKSPEIEHHFSCLLELMEFLSTRIHQHASGEEPCCDYHNIE
jgi:hypothetical protein